MLKSKTLVRRTIGSLLIVAGFSLEFLSCSKEILRGGNEAIASMIALVGLFTIAAGWVGRRYVGDTMTDRQRIRLRLVFEHLAYSFVLGAWWVAVERNTFFADTPFGKSILPLYWLLLAVFAVSALLSVAFRVTLSTSVARNRMRALYPVSASAWQTFGIALAVLTILNVAQAQETLRTSDGLQVTIVSRGFPLPAIQKLQTSTVPVKQRPQDEDFQVKSLLLPNDTAVNVEDDTITVFRDGRLPMRLSKGVSQATLPDGTQVEFQERRIIVSPHGRSLIEIDSEKRTAAFINIGISRNDSSALIFDALLALVLAVHFARCTERLQRVDGRPFGDGLNEMATSTSLHRDI